MSMGTLSQLYGNLDAAKSNVAKLVANGFGVKPFILRSWLRHLTYIRNICGHHSRLYNRVVTVRPNLLRADARYDGKKEFPTLLVLKRMYEKSWPAKWGCLTGQIVEVVRAHPSVSLKPMGFPEDWETVIRCEMPVEQR